MVTPFVNEVSPKSIDNPAVISHIDKHNGSAPTYNVTSWMTHFMVRKSLDYPNPNAVMFRQVTNVNSRFVRNSNESEMEKQNKCNIWNSKLL